MYRVMAESASEIERRATQKAAWQLRKKWCRDWRAKVLAEKVARGGVLQKSKKLHTLTGIVLSEAHGLQAGSVSVREDDWAFEVQNHFAGKWDAGCADSHVSILNAILPHDGDGYQFTAEDLESAFARIKHKSKIDHYGISVAAIQLLFSEVPHLVADFFTFAAASTPTMACAVVKGGAYGKESGVCAAKDTRSILPLPSFMQVIDVVLPLSLESKISEVLPNLPECFVGARPKTQCLDVAHGLQSVIEKGLDDFGASAVAQCDIEKYYDSLPVLKIMWWLVDNGVAPGHAACLVRHQMCPQVVLKCGSAEAVVKNRTVGGLTGSRTAGFLGRIPVESIIADRCSRWRRLGYHAGQHVFCLCTWVDNLFSASDSLSGAISMLEDFEKQLRTKWSMGIKPTSRSCMVAEGNPDVPADLDRWPLVTAFPVLGHHLQANGSIRECWSRARASMWRAYWGNAGSRDAAHLSGSARASLVKRAVVPQFSFRCSRWAPQRQIASELDQLQQKMMSSSLRLPRLQGEDAPEYVRRRGRLARQVCKENGNWSHHWFGRALHWDEHLNRVHNSYTWAARLRDFHGKQWLIDKRASFAPSTASRNSPASILAGRTGTRAFRGKVHMRWHDGIDMARDVLGLS